MTKHRLTSIALGLATGAALLVGYTCVNGFRTTDDVLASGYGRALADADTAWNHGPAHNIWLSGQGEQPASLRKAVALGDRITVGGHARSDVYEVVGLEHIEGEALGMPTLRIQVVTARIDSRAQSETVRFLFAVEAAPTAPASPPPGKVL